MCPWTYDGDPSSSDVAAVRFEIQDTDVAAQLLTDAEVSYAILQETTVAAAEPATITGGGLFAAAARCLEVIAVNLSRQADTEIGQMKVAYANAAKSAAERAQALRAKSSGYYAPYSGGQSRGEDRGWRQDEDLTQPAFSRRQFDSSYAGSGRRGDGGALPPMQD